VHGWNGQSQPNTRAALRSATSNQHSTLQALEEAVLSASRSGSVVGPCPWSVMPDRIFLSFHFLYLVTGFPRSYSHSISALPYNAYILGWFRFP
jgi:hypothetical protein